MFDTDSSGYITAVELQAFLTSLGQPQTEASLRDLMEELDQSGDGRIEFAEFSAMMINKTKNTDEEEEIEEAFRFLDRDDSGAVSAAELTLLLEQLGETEFSTDDVARMIRLADRDGDGEISLQEFKEVFRV